MSKKTGDTGVVSQGEPQRSDEMWVAAADGGIPGTRGGGLQQMKVQELAVNVHAFIQQVGKILESAPDTLGAFHFDEFEIHAEISADGTVALLGSGVHAGASGGLRFVFRRASTTEK